MLPCPDENLITALVEGRLDDEQRRELEAHCDACERCARLLVELGRMLAPDISAGGDDMAGRYRLLDPVGAGGMGVVFAAFDTKLSRKVAMKRLHAGAGTSASDEMRRMRFLREAQLLASLSHPNVLTVYDLGLFEGELAIVMELVDGWALSSWLDECKPDAQQIVNVFLQAGRGIAAAHRVGIVHRDIKPDNILVARSGRVMVSDFGLAGLAGSGGARRDESPDSPAAPDSPMASLTRTGEVLGTPAYMAPEQRQGAVGDEQSDQYSFCVSLYDALHGRQLFQAVATDRRRHRARWNRVSRRIDAVLAMGLDPDPTRRFASMDALLAALERAARPHRRLWLLVTVAVSMASLAAGGWLSMRARHSFHPRSAVDTGRPAGGTSSTRAVDAALNRARQAVQRRDGATCLQALEDALRSGPMTGEAWLRGQCEMLRGRCDEGRAMLSAWAARDGASGSGSPAARKRAADELVHEYALLLCPPTTLSSTSDRFQALARQSHRAEQRHDTASCRSLAEDLSRMLPEAPLEAAHATCDTWKRARFSGKSVSSDPPEACDQPRGAIASALGSIGSCELAAGTCADGLRRLRLAQEITWRDSESMFDSYASLVSAPVEEVQREYPLCAAAAEDELRRARQIQAQLDSWRASPAGRRRDETLARALAGTRLTFRCEAEHEAPCRLMPVLGTEHGASSE